MRSNAFTEPKISSRKNACSFRHLTKLHQMPLRLKLGSEIIVVPYQLRL